MESGAEEEEKPKESSAAGSLAFALRLLEGGPG